MTTPNPALDALEKMTDHKTIREALENAYSNLVALRSVTMDAYKTSVPIEKITEALAALDRIEAQPAEDDVREAVEFADKERKAWKEKADNETHAMLREHAYRPIEKHYETLIRAATAPKYTEEQ